MNIRLIIVADESMAEEIFHILEVSQEVFEIVKAYDIGHAADKIALEWDGIEHIPEIGELQYDYILNANVMEMRVYSVLEKLAPKEKILGKKEFCKLFLDENASMEYLKYKIKKRYPMSNEAKQKVCMGDFSYGSPFIATSGNHARLTVGKFCSFAQNVIILLEEDHRMDWNTTYPFNTWMSEFSCIQGHPTSKGDIIIGNDVWIGFGAAILSGVTIGDGCVIGANAVVAKSIPPYSIAVGNPAQIVKKRFDEVTIERLLEMKWWEWENKHIYHAISMLQSSDTDALYQYYLKYIKR